MSGHATDAHIDPCSGRAYEPDDWSLAPRFAVILIGFALCHCGLGPTSSATGASGDGGGDCFPDNDGIVGGVYTFDLTVDDTGFSKTILATQNDAQVTVTLHNEGTKPHGFLVGCANVVLAYPTVVAGCPFTVCFPSNALILPLAPGASATVTFDTPTPDGLIFPFGSGAPDDSTVPGLNDGQWIVN